MRKPSRVNLYQPGHCPRKLFCSVRLSDMSVIMFTVPLLSNSVKSELPFTDGKRPGQY